MSYYCPICVPPPLKAVPHQGIRSSQIFASGPMAIAHPIKCWKAGSDFRMNICASIFAHNEERRMGSCLNSLPLDRMDIAFHVLVNGSDDRTADRARNSACGRATVHLHGLIHGGKSRTWNRRSAKRRVGQRVVEKGRIQW